MKERYLCKEGELEGSQRADLMADEEIGICVLSGLM